MQSMGNPTEVDLPLLLARKMHFRFARKGEKFPLDEKALIERGTIWQMGQVRWDLLC